MKILLLLSGLLFSNMYCQQQLKPDCTKFRNGKFSIHSELNNQHYTITRKDSSQVEKEKETGKITEWKVSWLNDCEYRLILVSDNFGLLKNPALKTIPDFTYKITRTTKDYYIFENRYDVSKPLLIDTLFLDN